MANRLSLRDAAADLQVDHSTLFRWEHADRLPAGDNAVRYAEFIDSLVEATR